MTNLLQEIANKPKNGEEENRFYIRFNDLPPNKQMQLIKLIIKTSSIWTIKAQKKISEQQIIQIMEATNPIIWNISKNHCTYDPIFRWRERALSQLIYHYWRVSFSNKRPQPAIRRLTDWLVWAT